MGKVVRDVLNLIEADVHAEGIPVRVETAEGLPTVRADAVQLQQVLLNLRRNSVDAMRDGLGVGLAISRTIFQSYEGSLTYADNPEGGAIFSIELPAEKESAAP